MTLLTTLAFTILLSIVVVGMGVVICKLKSQVIEKKEKKTFFAEIVGETNNDPEDILSQFDALTATVNKRLADVRTLLESKPGPALQMMNKKQQHTTFTKPAERNNVS